MPSNAPSRGPISNRKPSGTKQLDYLPRVTSKPAWQGVDTTGVVKNTLADEERSLGKSRTRALGRQRTVSVAGRVSAFH